MTSLAGSPLTSTSLFFTSAGQYRYLSFGRVVCDSQELENGWAWGWCMHSRAVIRSYLIW